MKPYDQIAAKRMTFFIGLLFCVCISGCEKMDDLSATGEAERYVPTIVTGEIKEGIEKHIAEQVVLGNGYFTVPFEGKELKLKLVRVHVEYLASLAPQRHFACGDMASADGEFYDIDFFSARRPRRYDRYRNHRAQAERHPLLRLETERK